MFTVQNLQINRGSTSANAQGKFITTLHTYKDESLTVGTIKSLFPDYLGQGALQDVIAVGDHMLVLGSDTTNFCKILSLAPFTLGLDLFAGASGLSVTPTIDAVDNNAAHITGDTLQMEKADKTHSGIITEVAQDIGGEKTLWANTTIIPANDFIVAGEGDPPINLLIKTQDELGGIQIQTNSSSNVIGYTFGSVDNDPNVGGIYYKDIGYPNSSPTVSILAPSSALYLDSTGISIPSDFYVDTINEFTLDNGTVVNGTTVKGTTITFADANVYIDNGVSLANQIKFNFDTSDDDYLHYDKTTRTFAYATGGIDKITISPTSTVISNLTIAQSSISVDTINEFTPAAGITMTNTVKGSAAIQSNTGFDTLTAAPLLLGQTNATQITFPNIPFVNFMNANTRDNLVMGRNAFLANTTGTDNVAIGRSALAADTTGGPNVAIGLSALASNTTGNNNIAIGQSALTANIVGFQNIGIGLNALAVNNAAQNVAIGANALAANTSGGPSVAIGLNALTANTTGTFNVAVGSNALAANTTGTPNIAIGSSALAANIAGANNVAMGNNALTLSTASNNIAVGSSALVANTTGAANVAIGTNALAANTSGSPNIAVGFGALALNTTGINNVGIGNSALAATTGNNNTAVGTNAMLVNTTGANNVAVGRLALTANTNGSSNVAIGASALAANNTGTPNTAIGTNALAANTSGGSNVALGFGALSANTTVSSNTAVGASALAANTTGTPNTAVGASALAANTTGGSNTAIGKSSLAANTTGASNTVLGTSAGASLATGSSNLILGSTAGSSYTAAESNNILLSYAGVAAESNAIHIGDPATHTTNFQAGVSGVTVAGAVPVVIGATGQMGTTISLRSKKENITALSADDNSEIIKKLEPVKFDYIGHYAKHQQYGLIADDVEKICPELCAYDEKDELQTVYYDKIVMMLLKEVQSLRKRIESLEE